MSGGFLAMSHAGQVSFTVQVTVDHLPEGDKVHIVGNVPSLGTWDPAGVPLNRSEDGVWSRSFDIDADLPVQFKITRGSWVTEALNADDTIPENNLLFVTQPTTVSVHVAKWKDEVFSQRGHVTGTVIYHRAVEGDGLMPRDIVVWFPPDYESNAERRYPVLYMHDGQNVFDPSTSAFGHEWQVDEEADRLIREGAIEPMIVVGMYNTPNRTAEYGDDRNLTEKYVRFVIDRVKPMIDQTYRTKPDAANTAVMGSSMGGLISFIMAWDHPDVFSKAGCLSPAFIRSDVLDRVKAHEGEPKPIRIYMDNGTIELESVLQPGCDQMLDLLRARGYAHEWFLDEGSEHNEQAWAARVEKPLRFLFGAAR